MYVSAIVPLLIYSATILSEAIMYEHNRQNTSECSDTSI